MMAIRQWDSKGDDPDWYAPGNSEKRQLSKNQVLTGRKEATLLTATFKLIEPLTFVNDELGRSQRLSMLSGTPGTQGSVTRVLRFFVAPAFAPCCRRARLALRLARVQPGSDIPDSGSPIADFGCTVDLCVLPEVRVSLCALVRFQLISLLLRPEHIRPRQNRL